MVPKKYTTLVEPSLRQALQKDLTLQYSLGFFLAMGLLHELIGSHLLLTPNLPQGTSPPQGTPIGYDGLRNWFERTCQGRKDIHDAFIATTRVECRLEFHVKDFITAEVHFFESGQISFFVCRVTFARTGEVSAVGYGFPSTTPPTEPVPQS